MTQELGLRRGWREALVGVAVSAFALIPMGSALLDPSDSAFPSGRMPAFLAGAAFFFAGICVLGAGLGRTWRVPVALLLSTFAGVPFALALGDAFLAREAFATPLLNTAQALFLGTIAAYLWAWVLRQRAVAPGSGIRGLGASALKCLAISPFLAPLAPLAAAVGLAAPVLALGALVTRTRSKELSVRTARLAFTLSALALVVAPARALVRAATRLLPLPETQLRGLGVADPAWSATIDLLAGGAGIAAVALASTRARMPPGPIRDAAALLPDRAHAAAVAALSGGLALASLLALHPEFLPGAPAVAPEASASVRRAILRIESADPAWRARALQDLEDLDADLEPAMDHLLALLEHPDHRVRGTAATALRVRGTLSGKAPCPRCLEALTRDLASPVPEVRRLALLALPGLAPEDVPLLHRVRGIAAKESAALRDEALGAVAASGGAGKALLLHALHEDDGTMNAALLRALEPVMEEGERRELLGRLLASPDPGARWLAVQGLGALGRDDRAAAAELAAGFAREQDPTVRDAAFLALADAAPGTLEEADPALLAALLPSRLWAVRVAARELLERLDPPRDVVIPALLAALDGGDTYAREQAMTYLRRLGAPPEAAPRVARCIVEDGRQGLRVAAAELLGSMGVEGAPGAGALAEIAVGGDTYAGARALAALAAIGPPARGALPLLEAHAAASRPAPAGLLEAIARIAPVEPRAGGGLP